MCWVLTIMPRYLTMIFLTMVRQYHHHFVGRKIRCNYEICLRLCAHLENDRALICISYIGPQSC